MCRMQGMVGGPHEGGGPLTSTAPTDIHGALPGRGERSPPCLPSGPLPGPGAASRVPPSPAGSHRLRAQPPASRVAVRHARRNSAASKGRLEDDAHHPGPPRFVSWGAASRTSIPLGDAHLAASLTQRPRRRWGIAPSSQACPPKPRRKPSPSPLCRLSRSEKPALGLRSGAFSGGGGDRAGVVVCALHPVRVGLRSPTSTLLPGGRAAELPTVMTC
jgi:hypothetical protein